MFSVMEEALNLCLYFSTFTGQTAFGEFMFLTNKHMVPNPLSGSLKHEAFPYSFQPSIYGVPLYGGLPKWLSDNESACQCRRCRRFGFRHWVGKMPWRRAWQPTAALLPRESHGQRSLAGYSPWGRKESGVTE